MHLVQQYVMSERYLYARRSPAKWIRHNAWPSDNSWRCLTGTR
jgi:hypothetical protein